MNYLQERCSVLEDQIEQHISNEEKYENQINNFVKSVNQLQNQVNGITTEKDSVIGDLYAVRELCVRLDQTREELTKKLAEKTAQHDQVCVVLLVLKLTMFIITCILQPFVSFMIHLLYFYIIKIFL